MIQIRKIENKETIEVLVQENCRVEGKSHRYINGQDCLYDCGSAFKPRWYKNPKL